MSICERWWLKRAPYLWRGRRWTVVTTKWNEWKSLRLCELVGENIRLEVELRALQERINAPHAD